MNIYILYIFMKENKRWKYYLEHADEINKQYAEVTKGKIIGKDSYTCICGSKFRFTALKTHLASIKHINFTARAAQNEKVDQKTDN